MKWLTLSLFLLGNGITFGQYIYVQSSEPFTLQHSSQEAVTSIWVKIIDESKPVPFKLKSGKTLNRHFKIAVEPSVYVVDRNAIRYRPNSEVLKADTVEQPIIGKAPEVDSINMAKTIAEIHAMKYEYEKVEAVKQQLEEKSLACEDIQRLINCVKYDASKVELINESAQNVSNTCFNELKRLVVESYWPSLTK